MERFFVLIAGIAATAVGIGGCATKATSNEFAVAAGQYDATFDAALEVLRESRFRMARIDASAGVLSTEEKASAGLATPWDTEQSTLHQEFDDFLNQQRRTVRVTFEREGGGPPAEDAPAVGSVWVTVYRVQTAGLRVASKATGLTSIATDPVLVAQGTGAIYEVPVMRDPELEKQLAYEIAARAKKAPTEQPDGSK